MDSAVRNKVEPEADEVAVSYGVHPCALPKGSARVLTILDPRFALNVQDPTRCVELRQQCVDAIGNE